MDSLSYVPPFLCNIRWTRNYSWIMDRVYCLVLFSFLYVSSISSLIVCILEILIHNLDCTCYYWVYYFTSHKCRVSLIIMLCQIICEAMTLVIFSVYSCRSHSFPPPYWNLRGYLCIDVVRIQESLFWPFLEHTIQGSTVVSIVPRQLT